MTHRDVRVEHQVLRVVELLLPRQLIDVEQLLEALWVDKEAVEIFIDVTHEQATRRMESAFFHVDFISELVPHRG